MNTVSDLLIGFNQMKYQIKRIAEYFETVKKKQFLLNFENQYAVKNFEFFTKKSRNIYFCMRESPILVRHSSVFIFLQS